MTASASNYSPARLAPAAALLLLIVPVLARGSQADETIWFSQPASFYTESCPLGNGHLGAMLFGGVTEERLVLNETGMWSGSPQPADREGAAAALPEIRRLLFSGHGLAAQNLIQEKFTALRPPLIRIGNEPGRAPGAGSVTAFGCFQTLGSLWLEMDPPAGSVRDYRRELDLSRAVAQVSYEAGGTRFSREAFVSAPDDVIVFRLTADRPGQISCRVRLNRPERFRTTADGADQLLMTGGLDSGLPWLNARPAAPKFAGVHYAARLQALPRGGSIAAKGDTLEIVHADEVVFLINAITDIHTYAGSRSDDPVAATARSLIRASQRGYETLRDAHVRDYAGYYRRMSLSLGPDDPRASGRATPERLQAYHRGAADPSLAALYFNFGRYLLISSSRPGGLPPNLVGLWAEEIQTPWNGDWHLDVNLEMNYWAIDVTGLSDLFQPYFDFIASLQAPGARTAKTYFGARGWTSFSLGNPWGFTSPGWNGGVGVYPSSAWLCQGLWDHYVYTQDLAYLRRAYPILRGAARFFADALAEEPAHHWLVTAPSNSPENPYLLPNGDRVSDCAGPTIDEQQIRELFGACIEAGRLLGLDPDLQREWAEKRARLAPTRVASDGRIMEWLEEYREADPHHRHVSPLWGLYPGTEITPKLTPELAAAARKSLEGRGDGGQGWTLAFKIALWARLGDGNRAFRLLQAQLAPVEARVFSTKSGGGTYPNLFDACPPFEIDADLGGPAAIAEMLLQSNEGDLHLLPALPDAWPEGSVQGLRARGGLSVDLGWKDKKLVAATIHGPAYRSCDLRYGGVTTAREIPADGTLRLDGLLRP